MARSLRVYFTGRQGYCRQNFNWGGGPITRHSVVHVSVSEATYNPGNPPLFGGVAVDRWLGDSRFTVHNVCPHDGGVTFSYSVDWPHPHNVAVDITVFDPPELVWHDAWGSDITPRVP